MAQSTKSRKMGLPEVREPAQGWKRGQSSDLNPGQPNSQFSVEAHILLLAQGTIFWSLRQAGSVSTPKTCGFQSRQQRVRDTSAS